MSPPSLRRTAARHALSLATTEELIATADALLACGIYSYALGELGTSRSSLRSEVEPLFFRVLKEFRIAPLSAEQAADTLVRRWIYNIAEEVVSPLEELSRCFQETFAEVRFPQFASLLESTSGGRELLELASQHDEIEDRASAGDLTPEQREERLAALDRRTRAFAQDWMRTQVPRVVDPAWLTANDGLVASLARTIREGRRFEELPVLADALEEAGCTDANLLAHCRDPGAHRERCWALDLLLESGEAGGAIDARARARRPE